MSNYEARPNNYLLFRQDKAGNDRRPDYSGQIEIEGAGTYSAALWGRKDRNGKTYLALRLRKKESQIEQVAQQQVPKEPETEIADIPF
jgi:hypothetical protein